MKNKNVVKADDLMNIAVEIKRYANIYKNTHDIYSFNLLLNIACCISKISLEVKKRETESK